VTTPDPVEVPVVAPALPSPWANQAVGSTAAGASASESDGVISLAATGTGIGGKADAADYVYQTLAGNGSIVAHVQSAQSGTSEAGIMLRTAATAGSQQAALVVTAKGVKFAHRAKVNAAAGTSTMKPKVVPQWVELVRKGNTVTAYDSTDGIHWKRVGSTSIKLGASVEVGLAAASGNSTTGTAMFSNVSVT
jgi:regulation of enolase protein 1 (concanavalin A-like superfamily)